MDNQKLRRHIQAVGNDPNSEWINFLENAVLDQQDILKKAGSVCYVDYF